MSEGFDLARFSSLDRLALATDEAALIGQAEAALAALLPGHTARIALRSGEPQVAQPGEATGPRAPTDGPEPDDGAAIIPLEAAGEQLGAIVVAPGQWAPEQGLGLKLLAAIFAPTYLALHRARVSGLERRKAALRGPIDALRNSVSIQPLLAEVCGLLRQTLPFQHVACTLRYRDTNWVEMAYVLTHDFHGPAPMYWRTEVGLSGLVITNGEALYTDSYVDECARRGVTPLSDLSPATMYGWMGVPLRDNGTIFGALVAFATKPDQGLDPEDKALMLWLTAELSPIIRGAQRYERVHEESLHREGLINITRALNSSLDPEYVPTLIVERAPVLLDAEEGSLLLLDEETGELVFRYAAGPAGQQLLGQRLPPGKGIAGFVASSGQAAIVNNARTDGRFYRALDGDTGFHTRSILAVPLRGINGVRGVIEVLNRRDDAPFTEDDRALLEALADQAMIALENARQFASVDQALARRVQDLDRSNDRLHKILRASNALRAERQLDDLLPQIAGVVCESSGFRSAMIALVYRERTPEPYLRRAAIVGASTASLAQAQDRRLPLARFETLLRPEFRRGSLTYLVEGHYDEHAWIQAHALATHEDRAGGQAGSWAVGDTLFCLLHNSRGELIGILGFDNPEDGMRPGEAQVQILEILANQTAAAIENAHLYADQQASLNRMLALNALGLAISTTLRTPHEIYNLTARAMQEISDGGWATVFLGDPAADELRPSLTTGTVAVSAETGAQLAREAIVARRPVSRTLGRDGSSGTLVGIPLRGSRQTLGAICVGYAEGAPSAAEVETLVLFASQAASAVESLVLLGEVREGRDQLASIMASTREGMLLVSDEAQVVVANGAFATLAGSNGWPTAATTPVNLAGLPLEALLDSWQAADSFGGGEFALLRSSTGAVAHGLESFMRGQLNSTLPGLRALEWTVLRATREGVSPLDLPLVSEAGTWPILLTIRDITAAKETERLRNDLTSMMVHDLRSPLTSIMTSIDMIFRGIAGDVTTTQREILTIAYTSAQNLLNMVNLLLDISRLEGGRMPLERTALPVEGLVERAAGRLSVLARNKNIAIDVVVSPGAAYVHADGELVLRVLQNLLDNALKFSPKGSMVVITAESATSGTAHLAQAAGDTNGAWLETQGERVVRFAVRDSGTGIKQVDLEKIFTKFGQAGNRRSAGSGLGLTFCKLVTEAHGGRIWVESTPGVGSVFSFTLPAAEDEG